MQARSVLVELLPAAATVPPPSHILDRKLRPRPKQKIHDYYIWTRHIFDRKLFPRPKQKIHDYILCLAQPHIEQKWRIRLRNTCFYFAWGHRQPRHFVVRFTFTYWKKKKKLVITGMFYPVIRA